MQNSSQTRRDFVGELHLRKSDNLSCIALWTLNSASSAICEHVVVTIIDENTAQNKIFVRRFLQLIFSDGLGRGFLVPHHCREESQMSRSSVVAGTGYAAGSMIEIIERSEPSQRILIVNDVKLYRDALAVRLSQSRRITVIGAIHSVNITESIDRLQPDVLLYDVHDWTSLEQAQLIAQQKPDLKIVAIAVPEIARHAVTAASPGIAGWISRTESIDDVIALIMRLSEAHRGALETVLLHSVAGDQSAKTRAGPELTPRENEILRMIERGLSNKEIARDLRIEVGTVKNHVHNILEKLNVRRRDQAAHQMRQSFPD